MPCWTRPSAWYLEEFVDWEKGECDFGSAGFRRLLNWVGEHTDEPVSRNASQGDRFFRPGYLEEEALLMEKSTNRGFPLFIYLDGEGTETHGTSREMAEKLMEFLETADFTPESGLRNMVVSIVLEETEAYYTGDKSLDEVVGIIQNRVQLLLKENM